MTTHLPMDEKDLKFNSDYEAHCKVIHEYCHSSCRRGRLMTALVEAMAGGGRGSRQQIMETYTVMYGKDIGKDMESIEITTPDGELSQGLVMWMAEADERDAMIARDALLEQSGGGEGSYRALVEIFVGRKSSHVALVKRAYQTRFRRHLDQDIASLDTPHPYQRILRALSTSHKAHHEDVNEDAAKSDAIRLHRTAIDEAVVLELLTKRSIPHLKLTFYCYHRIYGHNLIKALKKEKATQFEVTLRSVVKCMCNPPKYYAKMLHSSLRAQKSDTRTLTRIMVSREEIDMFEIRGVFCHKYGMGLRDAICESIPLGDYRDFLVALATATVVSSSSKC
ncbi:hypothetical protein Ancab_015127 [Ancistrocladus abbreviatus]